MAPPRGTSSSSSGPSRRPPPLLVLAAAGLAAVIALAVVLIFMRGDEDRPIKERASRSLAAEPEVTTPPSSTPAPTPTPTSRASTPSDTSVRTRTVQEVIAETGEIPPGTRPEDLPIWARPPRVTTQPFPEGARINPPLPPVKIPPEMLVPLPAADAASPTVP